VAGTTPATATGAIARKKAAVEKTIHVLRICVI
jgi:hypothetical protein